MYAAVSDVELKLIVVVPMLEKPVPVIVTLVPPRFVPAVGEMLATVTPAATAAGTTISRIIRRKNALIEGFVNFSPNNPFTLQSVVISDLLIVI
jgi:hypothetical protein